MRAQWLFAIASIVALNSGCIAQSEQEVVDEELVSEVEQALEMDNALNPNALNPNALNPNALNPNALNPNALNPNSLSQSALASIRLADGSGDMSRLLLKYIVSCALDSTQTFSFTWTDASGAVRTETYRGLLGLATSWASGPLDVQGQMMVSACLASRTNYYGVSVTISSRSAIEPLKSNTSSGELQQYVVNEGSFWGNLFASVPYLRACYRSSNVDYARSVSRECAAGHVNADGSISTCGMIQIVGPCGQHCSSWNSNGQYWGTCGESNSSMTSNVITVGLR